MTVLYQNINQYSLIQTFFADPAISAGSTEITLTSIDLYFKKKPDLLRNTSGSTKPGVVVSICEVEADTPILSKGYFGSNVRKDYDEIIPYRDASVPTKFTFTNPLKLKTGKFYGIVVYYEDSGYDLWVNKQGDKLVGTGLKSAGSNNVKDGKLYLSTNANVFKPLSDSDLKFAVKVAKYVSNTATTTIVNNDYEFLRFNFGNGTFLNGEYIHTLASNASGNISITAGNNVIIGTGTSFNSFDVGTKIAVYGNTSHTQVYTIGGIVNATYMTTEETIAYTNTNSKFMVPVVAQVFHQDPLTNDLFLYNSTANSTNLLANSTVIIGSDSRANGTVNTIADFSVDHFKILGDLKIPASARVAVDVNMAQWNGSAYTVSNTVNDINRAKLGGGVNYVNNGDTRLISRSIEVVSNLFNNTNLLVNNKSLMMNVVMSTAQSNVNLFSSPVVENGKLDLYVARFNISNVYTTTDANSVIIDTEVAGNGKATSKHISTKLKFANNKFAEDLRVYMTAYRPANTNLRVYARLHNSADPDAFDDKSWTPLTYTENADNYSSSTNRDDFIEYTLGLPAYSESANVLPGTFTTQLSNTIIVASGVTPTTYLANNDMIKIYNPIIPENYIVAVAQSVNSTAIVLGDSISNNNLVGNGFKVDRLKYNNIAFNNVTTDNVVRYYNSSLVEFDTFDSVQIKIVFLSDTTYNVPRVDVIRTIGVSVWRLYEMREHMVL